MALTKSERWLVQIMVPEGTYTGADELIADLTTLIEDDSEIEVISVELDPEIIPDPVRREECK